MCVSNVLACVVIIAALAAGIICVVGLSIPVWNTDDASSMSETITVKRTTYEGLWHRCTLVELDQDTFTCDYLWEEDSYTASRKATLAMCLIGVVLITSCAVIMALHLTLCSLVDYLTRIAAFTAILAGGFILIGIIVYGADVHDSLGGDLSAGFGLCLTSALLCLAVGLVCFFVD